MGSRPLDILVIRFSSLGDIVLTLPALEELRVRLPAARLRYLTREPYAGLLELCPSLDDIVRYDGGSGLRQLIDVLRAAPPDVVLDLHGSLRSRMVCAALRAPVLRAPGTHLRRRRMLGCGSLEALVPVWQMHRRTAAALFAGRFSRQLRARPPIDADGVATTAGTGQPGGGPLLEARAEDRAVVDAALAGGCRARALLPGARWATKQWPSRHFAAVAAAWSTQGICPVVLGAPEETALVSEIVTAAGGSAVGYSGGSWSRLIAWLERCESAVGNDSGLTHLAEAVGVSTIALFGPTVPEFGFGPRLPGSRVLARTLSCRPCSLHGTERCPLGHHACLEALEPEHVLGAP